jgi:HEAT repeat protein
VTGLRFLLILSAVMLAIGVVATITWVLYTTYLGRLERRLEVRKGLYRDLVTGLASRERALLEPELRHLGTLHDFEALEAVLEEQARGVVERPGWLLDAYDRLGLVDKYAERLKKATRWRERAFAAELLGRVGNAKAVPVLLDTIQATRTEDADVREISLRALARIADPRAVPPLIEALKKSEVWLTPRIADILVRHGGLVVDPMIAFLQEESPHPARSWAANILGELKAIRAFPALVRALSDLDDEVRAKSAGALGRLGDRRAVTYLLDHLLTDPAPFVRARIAGALGQFIDAEVISHLVRALGDPAWWVRMRSVEALEQIGPSAESPLLLALGDPDPEIRIRAAVGLERLGVPMRLVDQIAENGLSEQTRELLVKFGTAGAREFLAEHLAHKSPRVREAIIRTIRTASRHDLSAELIETARQDHVPELRLEALDTLRAFSTRDALPAALDCLSDPDEHVRTAAMNLVGDIGGADVAALIVPRTRDAEASVRAASARALGLIRAVGVEEDVIRLVRDPVPAVRVAAAESIAEGRWPGTLPAVVELLGDGSDAVRVAAVRAIGAAGNAAQVPPLIRAFRLGSGELRQATTEAVARLAPEELQTLLDLLLEREDVESRLAAVRTIAHTKPEQTVRLLELLWRDPAPQVRVAAGEALARLGGTSAADILLSGLGDPEESVRASTVDCLVRLGGTDAGPTIATLLRQDPSPLVRERAALAVGLFQVPGGEVELLTICHSEQPATVRSAAVLAIGVYDQESIVAKVLEMADEPALRDLLRDRLRNDAEYRLLGLKLHHARHVELRALSATTREQMEETLAEGMRGVLRPEERIRLVSALRAFQGEHSRSALLRVVRGDPSPDVRAAALTAAGGMLDADELLLAVQRALHDPHLGVRRAAVGLCSKLAPAKALPLLIHTIQADDDEAILQGVAVLAETAFEVFLDLTLGLPLDGQQGLLVTRVARYVRHPDLKRLLPALSRDPSPSVREAVADLWSHRPELIDDPSLETLALDPVVPVRRTALKAWLAARRFDQATPMEEDPDPGIRRDLALGLRFAPSAPSLASLAADPDEMVRAAVFVARLLRAETDRAPDSTISRAAAAAMTRQAAGLEELRATVHTARDVPSRLAAALALAVLDDAVAHESVRSDPSKKVRERVRAMLDAWGTE